MKKIFTLCFFLLLQKSYAQQFYNRYPSPLDLNIYSVCDILESGNAFYKIETESNNSASFHSTIRIVKTAADGSIQWIKRYDAGNDSSLQATNIGETIDHQLIVSGVLANDNAFPPLGVTMMKLDTSGNVIWCVLFPGFRGGYQSKTILQLDDSSFVIDAESSASLNSCLIKIDNQGMTVSSVVFMNMPYTGSNSVTSMIKEGEKITLAFNYGDFVTIDSQFTVLSDKIYQLDQTGPYFVHGLAANGDHLFVSDVIAGGLLEGQPRVFRTDTSGNLIWSKKLTIWNSFTMHTPFTLYDVTQAQNVFEDTSGNIVAVFLDEGGVGLAVTFDAVGNYLTNKVMKGAHTKLCTDGDLLFASNFSYSNSLGIFGKQQHYSLNDCDSLIDVQYSNNTDSASATIPSTYTSNVPITLQNFPVQVMAATTNPVVYCPSTTGMIELSSIETLTAFPNPVATGTLLRETHAGELISLYDMTGKKILEKKCDYNQIYVNMESLEPGIYFCKTDKYPGCFIRLVKF